MKPSGPLRRDTEKARAWQDRSRKPLARKTALKSGGPIQRKTEIGRHVALARSKPLRRISAKKAATLPARREVKLEVFARDGGCLLARLPDHRCFGELTPHHLRKEGQGGETTAANVVALCAGGNDWVEDEPDIAWALGLVIREGESPLDAWKRRRANGLVPVGMDVG